MSKTFDFKSVTIADFVAACHSHAKGGATVCRTLCARMLQGDGFEVLMLGAASGYGFDIGFEEWKEGQKKNKDLELWLSKTRLPAGFVSNVKRLMGAEDSEITAVMNSGKALNNSLLSACGVPTVRPKGEKAAADTVVQTTAERAAKIAAIEAQHDVPHPTMEGMVRILARWLSQSSSWDMGIVDEMQALHNTMLIKLSVPMVQQEAVKAAAKTARAVKAKPLQSVKVAA